MNPNLTPSQSIDQPHAPLDPIPSRPADLHDPPPIPNLPASSPRPQERERVVPSAGPGEGRGLPPSLPDRPRKTRSDAKLLNLPPEQREQLIQVLLDGMAYTDARIIVEADFGIEVKCLTRFSEFWYRFCAPLLLKQRQQMVEAAHTHAALAPNDANALDVASFDAIRQRAYAAATAPGSTLEEVSFALAMISQVRALEDNRRRLELDQTRLLNRKAASGSAPKTQASTPAPTTTPIASMPAATPPSQPSNPPQPKLPRRARRAAFAAQHRRGATAHRGPGALARSL